MSVTYVNPEHPMAKIYDEHNKKLMIILLLKLGLKSVDLTEADIALLAQGSDTDPWALVTHGHRHSIELKVMRQSEAEALLRLVTAEPQGRA